MLVVSRARVHGPLLAGFLGTALLLCGIGAAVVSLVDDAVDDGAREVASQQAGADLAMRISLDLAADPVQQDEQVRAALARSLADLSAPWEVDRTVAGEATLQADEQRMVTVASVPDLDARADLVAGSWAGSDDDVVVQADAAKELGLRPGDDVLIGGVPLQVAGTWRASDYLDPRWLGDPQVEVGSADGQFGPVVVAESRWPELDSEPRARWVLVPDLDHVTAADLDAVVDVRDDIDRDWAGHVDDLDTVVVDGRLGEVAQAVALRSDGLRAVEPVVLILLAAVGLVTLAALARLFASTHAQELALLWARGASPGALAGAAALETAAAAAIGGAVSLNVLAVAVVAATAGALTAGQVHLVTASHAWRGPTGRTGRLVGPGLVVLVVAGAALAVWQLRSYGSPVTVGPGGVTAVDPVAVAAPAALLVAIVLLALTAFPLAATLVERWSGSRDVTRVLAARHLSRRLVPVTAPVVVVAIAAATLVGAATYARTWADGFDTTRQLRAGADVRVSTSEPGPDEATLEAVRGTAGVDAVAPVGIQLGGDAGSLVAVSPAALDVLARGVDRERAVAALTSDTSAPELPADTDRVQVVVEISGLAAPPRVTLVLADAAGALERVVLEAPAYAAPLAADSSGVPGPRTVVAVDVDVETGDRGAQVGVVSIAGGPGGTAVLDDETWTAQVPGDRELSLAPGADAPSGDAVVDPGMRAVRFTPSFAPGSPAGPRVPVVLSVAAADQLDLHEGDPLELALDGTYQALPAEVADVLPAVPGAPEEAAVLVDLRAVEQARLYDQEVVSPPTDLWIGTDDPEAVAAELRRALPANSRIETATDAAGRAVLVTAAQAWWLGAIGCGLLALLTLATVARGQLRSRRGDVAVLRALGLSVREQQRLRGRELGWTVAFGLLAGLVAGAAVAVLVVPQLARAAVPEPYPTIATGLAVDVVGLLGGAVLLVGALGAAVAVYAARVGAEARRARGPEADR